MIVQVDKACWKCGSWYRKKYGPKYYCNKCKKPDWERFENEEPKRKWEDRIRDKAEKDGVIKSILSKVKEEPILDAIQTELQF